MLMSAWLMVKAGVHCTVQYWPVIINYVLGVHNFEQRARGYMHAASLPTEVSSCDGSFLVSIYADMVMMDICIHLG